MSLVGPDAEGLRGVGSTRPTTVYLPTLVAADGSQFRRGSAYEGSKLDDWRIPYKYRIESALNRQLFSRHDAGEVSDVDPAHVRFGVLLVLRNKQKVRFIL